MSEPYPKIHSIWKRDERGHIVPGSWSRDEFEFLADRPWLWTEKVDGTNIRIGWRPMDESVGPVPSWIRGRSDNAQIPPKLLAVLVDLWHALPWSTTFPDVDGTSAVWLYGEGYGAGIQKGGHYRPDPGFVLFDVKVGDWWLRRSDVEIVGVELGVDVVPLVAECPITEAIDIVRDGFKSAWPDATPEGLVGRPAVDLWNRQGQRVTTKLKWRDLNGEAS